MNYLSESELSLYTSVPITMLDAENASLLIDSYKGVSFGETKRVESVKLIKKHGDYGEVYKGRLKHNPRIEIVGVTASTVFPFGVQSVDCGVDSIIFEDDSPYFIFIPQRNPVFVTPIPTSIVVTYMSGYKEIPEQLKRVTAQLAANLYAAGGGLKWISKEDIDLKITLTKDGIFTNEIKQMINLVEIS